MKTNVVRSAMIAGALAFGFCLTVAADDDEEEGGKTTYQTANVVMFGTGAPVGGAGTLFRSRKSLDVRIATTGLQGGGAFSVWWVVFNNPGACVGGCGGDDLGRADVRASVFYAAGFVTGTDGTANVTAHLTAGELAEGLDVEMGNGLEKGNGLRAEVHVVVRSHGAVNPGHVAEQIGSFNGACNPTCANKQGVAFAPVR